MASSNTYKQPYNAMQENTASSYLQQMLQGLAGARAGIEKDSAKLNDAQVENEIVRDAMLQASQQMGQLSQEQAAIDTSQALELQKRVKAVADTFGLDMLNPDNRIAMLVRERDAAIDDSLTNSKRAAQLASTNMFDSPFEYLIERPFLGENLRAASASQQKAEFITKAIADTQALANSSIETQKAINTSFTEEEAKIQSQILSIKAADVTRQLQLKQNQELIGDLEAMQKMRAADINLLNVGYQAKRHEDEFLMRREQYRQQQGDRAAAKKVDQISMEAYNKSAKALRKPPIATLEEFQARWNAFKGTEAGKVMAEMVLHGETILGASAGSAGVTFENYIGTDAGDSVNRLTFAQGSLPPEATPTAKYLFSEANLAEQEATKDKPGTKISEETRKQLTNARVYGQVVTDKKGNTKKETGSLTQMLTNSEQPVQGGRVENIYRAPDINTVGQAYPQLVGETWWRELYEPLGALNGGMPTVNDVMKQAVLRVKEGKLRPEEAAAGISTFYQAATHLNNKTRMYVQVGLPAQKGYPVIVDAPRPGILKDASTNVYERFKYSEAFQPVVIDPVNEQAKLTHYLMTATVPHGSLNQLFGGAK
jgi:hypothetical protein